MKKHKTKKSIQTPTNGNAEVFVLSPEILAKLGINIQTSQVQSTNLETGFEQNYVNSAPKSLNECKDESSIIETASLMKESVFLSPTFNESEPNVIPGEIPIANESNSSNDYPLQYVNSHVGNDCVAKEIIPSLNDKVHIEINHETCTVEDVGPNESVTEYQLHDQDSNFSQTNAPYENTADAESSNDTTVVITPFKEFTDECYILPDNMTDNTESFSESMQSKGNNSNVSNKIRILSEQVIFDLSQLKGVTSLISSSDNFIPITVDTVVSGKFAQNNSNAMTNVRETNLKQNTEIPRESVTCSISGETETNDYQIPLNNNDGHDIVSIKAEVEPEKVTLTATEMEECLEDIKIQDEIVIPNEMKDCNGDTTFIDHISKLDNTQKNHNITKIRDKKDDDKNVDSVLKVYKAEEFFNNNTETDENDIMLSSNTVVEKHSKGNKVNEVTHREVDSPDRVKEIASYLKQIANLRRKSIGNRKMLYKSKIDNQKRAEESDETQIENDQYISKFSKTYKRIAHKQIPAIIPMPQKHYLDTFQLAEATEMNDEMNQAINIHNDRENLNGQDNFCVCYDFGNLSYYDCEIIYEHIHFWERAEAKSDNICWNVFTMEIVNDKDGVISSVSDLGIKDVIYPCIEDSASIEPLQNSYLYDMQPEDEIYNDTKQMPQTNRKRSSQNMEDIKLESKKTVECDICNKMIIYTDWENHKKSEHNCVAWKGDQGHIVTTTQSTSQTTPMRRSKRNSVNLEIDSASNASNSKTNVSTKASSSSKLTKNTTSQKDIKNVLNSSEITEPSKSNSNIASLKVSVRKKDTKRSINMDSAIPQKKRKSEIKATSSSTNKSSEHSKSLESLIASTIVKNLAGSENDFKSSTDTESYKDLQHNKSVESLIAYTIEENITNITNRETSELTQATVNTKSTEFNQDSQHNESVESRIDSTIVENVRKYKTTGDNSKLTQETLQNDTFIEFNKNPQHKVSVQSRIASTIVENVKNCGDDPKLTQEKLKIDTLAHYNKNPQLNESVESRIASVVVESLENITDSEDPKSSRQTSEIVPCNDRISFEKDSTTKDSDTEMIKPKAVKKNLIICGVCKEDMDYSQWSNHILQHNYLAWREGDPELDLDNEEQVKNHLQTISKQLGGLVCSKCGLTRKFAKKYISHVKTCIGEDFNVSMASEMDTTLEMDEDDEALSVFKSRKSRKQRKIALPQVMVTCGVCSNSVSENLWIKHIQHEHGYLAWKDGEKPIDLKSEEEVKNHLNEIAKSHGLVCTKCGVSRRYVKKYLLHKEICQDEKTRPDYECGVCLKKGPLRDWDNHFLKAHYNIAWTIDQTPIDLKDLSTIENILTEYKTKYNFICNKCKTVRTSSLDFYAHIMTCGKTEEEIDAIRDKCEICYKNYLCVYKKEHMSMHNVNDESDAGTSVKRANIKGSSEGVAVKQERQPHHEQEDFVEVDICPLLKCGVCKKDVSANDWIHHIQREHAYLAWIEGEYSLDVDNQDQVRQHLMRLLHSLGELICNKCGAARKNEYSFRQHMLACDKSGFKIEITVPLDLKEDEYECGVCQQRGPRSKFKEHAMNKHYNIAWMSGDIPINVRNPYAAEKYLKEYKAKFQLVCKVCKASRASCYGFYAHILQCGKTNEELDAVHDHCDICNNKYLCIYRNQHVAMHREQEYKRDLKKMQEIKKIEEDEKNEKIDIDDTADTPSRKRKAAVKASRFIQNHSSVVTVDGKCVCPCGDIFSNEAEMSGHTCRDTQDSDVSVKSELGSEDSESEVDSNLSADEDQRKKIRFRQGEGSTKVPRMPFKVDNYASHVARGYRDFAKLHYATETLFDEWRNTEYPLVPSDEIEKYLPPIKESCKVRFGSAEWKTYKRFECSTNRGGIFTGGAVQCVSWAPLGIDQKVEDNYLCIFSHRGSDVPRCSPGDRGRDYALLQIWSCRDFTTSPYLSVGLALEYGVVWAVEWCPSGARDTWDSRDSDSRDSAGSRARLGLIAAACSDGSAYIFAVPYPNESTELEKIVYKLKPVAELRFSMNTGRRIYQATSIHWSHQKGHKIIMVGYSDGHTALYDLNTESPLLRGNENGVNIFYPFQDKQSEISAITGTVLIPTSNPHHATGSVCTASITGSTLRAGERHAPSKICHLSASAATGAPLWPAVIMFGDGGLTAYTVNECEWWGGGRRLGSARSGAACGRCARLAAACAPAVRLLRVHPAYPDVKKLIVATLLMVPLGHKRKQVNDDLSVVVEPLSYDDAVNKYGLELSTVTKSKKDQGVALKLCTEEETSPDRYPLSEIVACAFCPSERHHEKLAIATHSGLVFIINT